MKETFLNSKTEDGELDFHRFKTVYKTKVISDLIKNEMVVKEEKRRMMEK
jgi:hypothetical protein